MIKRITKLLSEHRRLSLGEIATALESPWEALEPIMDLLVRKGKVDIVSSACPRGSCSGCSCASRENTLIYELRRSESV